MNKHGFTLLEVTLFFAVSGLLALVAFAGLGPRLRNVRFTDAVRSLESITQKQLSNFQSGSNFRTEDISCTAAAGGGLQITISASAHSAGSSADCILNGRLAVISQEKSVYYPVVSLRKPVSTCTEHATYGMLLCHSPVIVGYNTNITEVAHRNGAQVDTAIALLYLQDPNGTETKLMGFNASWAPTNALRVISDGDLVALPQEACMSLSGRTALLQYNRSSLQPKITFEGC